MAPVAVNFPLNLVTEGGSEVTTLFDVQGNGKLMLIDFFAPWCASCPAAAKRMDEIATQYSDKVTFLLVSVDGGIDGARDFANKHGIKCCKVAAVEDEVPDEYDVVASPTTRCSAVLMKY
jgi:thiol-disulfide isomerase/thioredoxin